MLNYLKKFTMDILPSVAATIIGAYIVNHYINAKPADAPGAAVISKASPKTQPKGASKPASAETAAIPEPGIKAKGISERAMMENRAAERPAEVKPEAKPAEATAETKPAETKSAESKPAESKPAETKPAETAKPSEVATPPRRRDAADLARAAIERLRGSRDTAPRMQEAARQPAPPAPAATAPRLEEAPRSIVAVPAPQPSSAPGPEALRPLPPPITVSVPPAETQAAGAPANPPYTASVDPNRPVPPAEIPPAPPRPPIDLRADASKLADRTTNAAQDVLAATKSMFHALLPGNDKQSGSPNQFTD